MANPSSLTVILNSAPAPRERPQSSAHHACNIVTDYYDLSETLAQSRSACIVNISTTGMTLVVRHAIGREALLGVHLGNSAGTGPRLLVARVVRALTYRDGWMVACSFDRPLADEQLENLL
jgi:hypothetical protein